MIVKKMEKNGANFKQRLITPHNSSSSSLGPNGLLSRKNNKVKRMIQGKMFSNVEDEEELRDNNFNIFDKGFIDSIPRKLRSAISKRSSKYRSKRLLSHCSKKSKKSMNGCTMMITKEEEEVAETLFALSGMIPTKGESLEDKTPGLGTSNHADHMSSSEDPVFQNEDQGTACDELGSSERNTVHAKPLVESTPLSWPKLSDTRNLSQDFKVPQPLLRTCDEKCLSEKVPFPLFQSQRFVTDQGKDDVRGFGFDGLPIKSSANVFPSWINATASSSGPGTFGDSVQADKVLSSVNGAKKSRKRCITHVYISHLIQGMQTLEGKENPLLDAYQLRPSHSSSLLPNKNEMNGAFMSRMFRVDQNLPINLYHSNEKDGGMKNQSYEFLSLSSRVGSSVNSVEAKGQLAQLHSVSQASATLPFSGAQNWFSSKAYWNQVAVASMAMPPQGQLQMPQYFAHTSAKPTQHIQQPKSQQLQPPHIWTSQVAAQFRPNTPFLSSQVTNWHNQRISTQHIQPSSQPCLDMIGAKYLHISQHQQQQQQLMGRGPHLPLSNAKPQSGQLQTDGVLPFQLLCNERL